MPAPDAVAQTGLSPSPRSNGENAERVGLLITNSIKVGGFVLAMKEGLFDSPLDTRVLVVAAFMMAGAQGLETFLSALLGAKK